MIKQLKVFLMVAGFMMLTGCAAKTEVTTAASTTTYSGSEPAGVLQQVTDRRVIFSKDAKMPIMKDGIVYGTISINFVERLGIWDWNNYSVNQNGVRFSYAINYHVELQKYVSEHDTINLTMVPALYDGNDNAIGGPGYVGWSGYNASMNLYGDTPSGNCEVVLQPINPDTALYSYVTFDVTSTSGDVVFDTISVDVTCLLDAADGAQLKTLEDVTTVHSINGAEYKISFSDVFLEKHNTDSYRKIDDGYYRFYDFSYKIEYVSGPSNNREVLLFDSFNDYAMTTPPLFDVNSDVDGTVLTEEAEVPIATRYLWWEDDEQEEYVTAFPLFLKQGDSCTVTTNRITPSSTKEKATYIRIVLKFPSEVRAREFDEIREFDGRYVVYQLALNQRILKEKPDE